MKLAIIGLGKMGGNMARRLLKHGIEVVGFDFNKDTVNQISLTNGMVPASSVEDAVSKLAGEPRKIVWIMLPSGDITENQIKDLVPLLNKGDIIIDGGNSNYKHSQRRGAWLAEHGIDFIDCGTSGNLRLCARADPRIEFCCLATRKLLPGNGIPRNIVT